MNIEQFAKVGNAKAQEDKKKDIRHGFQKLKRDVADPKVVFGLGLFMNLFIAMSTTYIWIGGGHSVIESWLDNRGQERYNGLVDMSDYRELQRRNHPVYRKMMLQYAMRSPLVFIYWIGFLALVLFICNAAKFSQVHHGPLIKGKKDVKNLDIKNDTLVAANIGSAVFGLILSVQLCWIIGRRGGGDHKVWIYYAILGLLCFVTLIVSVNYYMVTTA